jgi:Holliday junction resolvasome RuvABC endonuclease subunit
MLQIPADSPSVINIFSIDPGTTMLGVAVITIDINTCQIIQSNAMTLNGDRLSRELYWLKDNMGDRFSRIYAIENQLVDLLNYYQPLIVASESPFINQRFPAAGIALTEVICAIRSALYRHDIWKTLKIVSPSEVKNAAGAKGNCDKQTMLAKIISLADALRYNGAVPIQSLDEHSIDALSVGFYEFKQLEKRFRGE